MGEIQGMEGRAVPGPGRGGGRRSEGPQAPVRRPAFPALDFTHFAALFAERARFFPELSFGPPCMELSYCMVVQRLNSGKNRGKMSEIEENRGGK